MSLRFIYQHSHFDDAFLNPKISGEGNILASGWSRLRRMEKLSCFNSSQRSNDHQKPISYPDGTWGDVNIFISGIAIDDGRVILRSEILTIDTFRYPKKNTRRGNSFLQSIIFRFHSVNFREEVDTSRFSTIKCSNASFPGERRILFFLGLQKGSRNPLKLVRHVHVGKPWAVVFCLSQHIVLEFGGDFLELFGSAELFVPFPACHFWTTVTLRNAAPRAIRNSWPRWKHAEFFLSQSGQRKSSIQKDYIPRRLTAGGPQNDELKKVDSGTKIWPFLVFILDFRGGTTCTTLAGAFLKNKFDLNLQAPRHSAGSLFTMHL